MQMTGTVHPPAAVSGYLMLHQPEHWTWLVFPILSSALLLSVLACVARRFVSSPPSQTTSKDVRWSRVFRIRPFANFRF
jgi:hypothetical protein